MLMPPPVIDRSYDPMTNTQRKLWELYSGVVSSPSVDKEYIDKVNKAIHDFCKGK